MPVLISLDRFEIPLVTKEALSDVMQQLPKEKTASMATLLELYRTGRITEQRLLDDASFMLRESTCSIDELFDHCAAG